MFMIKSDDQRQKTVKRIEGFETQARHLKERYGQEKADLFMKANHRLIEQFKEQIHHYDELKGKGLNPFKPSHLSEVGPYLVKARIVSNLTQSDLAKKLGVSQPMVYKYENTEYQGADLKLLSKIALALGISLNIETFRQPGTTSYHSKRQEQVILFFAQYINNTYLGKTKLGKLLYYADYEWIQRKGFSLTGDTYIALPYGPVPKHAPETLVRLKKRGAIRIEKIKKGEYDQERYTALKEADLSLFSAEEIEHLHNIARRFEFWTAKQMSDLTHEDWPWQSTKLGEEIVLYRIREGKK